jgi:sarcosine oxidase subunit delta
MQTETWHHSNGCRIWLKVKRNTATHEIESVESFHPEISNILKENK